MSTVSTQSTEVATAKRTAFVYKYTGKDGKEFSTKNKYEMLVHLLNKEGFELHVAEAMVTGMKPRKVNAFTQFNRDLTALKKALKSVSDACKAVSAKKEEKREEYIRKSLMALDTWQPNSQMSRKEKFTVLLEAISAPALNVTIPQEVSELRGMIEQK